MDAHEFITISSGSGSRQEFCYRDKREQRQGPHASHCESRESRHDISRLSGVLEHKTIQNIDQTPTTSLEKDLAGTKATIKQTHTADQEAIS